MKHRSRLSVIVTNYNHGRYLAEAVTQIIRQTRPADEVIIVDDASTDDSRDILTSLTHQHPYIRVICHETNQGVNRSVNHGVAESSGDYFTAVGADDPLFTHFFESAMRLCAANPSSAFCCGEYQSLRMANGGYVAEKWPVQLAGHARYFTSNEMASFYRTRESLSVPTAPAIWRREAWERAGELQPKLGWLADWFTALVVIFRHGACYVPDVSQSIRVDPNSHQRAGQSNLEAFQNLVATLLGVLEEPRYDDVRQFFALPAVLARFGFKILHLTSHDSRYVKYLSPQLIRNAVVAEGTTFDIDIAPLNGAAPAQLIPVAHAVLQTYAKAFSQHAERLAQQGAYTTARFFSGKALSADPWDKAIRQQHYALDPEAAPEPTACLNR